MPHSAPMLPLFQVSTKPISIRPFSITDAQDSFSSCNSHTHATHTHTHTAMDGALFALNLPVYKTNMQNTNGVMASEALYHITERRRRRQTSHPGAAVGFHASLNLGTLFGVFIVPQRPNFKWILPPAGRFHEQCLHSARWSEKKQTSAICQRPR